MLNTAHSRRLVLCLTCCGVLSAMVGCLKRTETITVHQDGRVELTVTFDGDPGDVLGGDAMLSSAPGWKVADQRKKNDDGGEDLVRTGSLAIPPGGEWPDSYAGPGDVSADVCLRFPSTLTIERRDDGTYYHFRRTYKGRPWARINHTRDLIFDEEIEALAKKDPDELKPLEQQSLVRAMIEFEKAKAVEFAEQAADELGDALTQDRRLAVRAGIIQVYDAVSIPWAVDLLASPNNEDRIEQEAAKLVERTNDAIESALLRGGVRSTVITRFVKVHDRVKRRFSVTEDLSDETWKVTLTMPGMIIGHNGDSVQDGTVTWEFDGEALRDRDQVLMATSKIAAEAPIENSLNP